jgi:hypothetical protein
MRTILIAVAVVLAGCGSSSTPAPEKAETKAVPAPAPAPKNNSVFLPAENQTRVLVMPAPLLDNKVLPGGTVGDYAGPTPYQLFIVETDSPQDAAILLLDWKGTLTNADFDAGFGGYFGTDNGKPVFGFTKGKYLMGVSGLDHKAADPIARVLAARVH